MFYSADFQGHGRKATLFEEFVRDPPRPIDVLIMEGTSIRPAGHPNSGRTEREVEADLVRTFKETSGLVLAMYSAQNIDRLVTMFRACLRSDNLFSISTARRSQQQPQMRISRRQASTVCSSMSRSASASR